MRTCCRTAGCSWALPAGGLTPPFHTSGTLHTLRHLRMQAGARSRGFAAAQLPHLARGVAQGRPRAGEPVMAAAGARAAAGAAAAAAAAAAAVPQRRLCCWQRGAARPHSCECVTRLPCIVGGQQGHWHAQGCLCCAGLRAACFIRSCSLSGKPTCDGPCPATACSHRYSRRGACRYCRRGRCWGGTQQQGQRGAHRFPGHQQQPQQQRGLVVRAAMSDDAYRMRRQAGAAGQGGDTASCA